jgi:hypothetical protein
MTILAGNPIDDVNAQIKGEGGKNRMRDTLATTNGTGKLIEQNATDAIRLGVMRGWLQLYKYNGNLLQNRLVARSKLPRAGQSIAGRNRMFASRNKRSAGGK